MDPDDDTAFADYDRWVVEDEALMDALVDGAYDTAQSAEEEE